MSTIELTWFKSSYSSASGDDCVEVSVPWNKSSHSSGSDGDCVEVASCPHNVHVRDSKRKQGPQLTFSAGAWTSFISNTAQA